MKKFSVPQFRCEKYGLCASVVNGAQPLTRRVKGCAPFTGVSQLIWVRRGADEGETAQHGCLSV